MANHSSRNTAWGVRRACQPRWKAAGTSSVQGAAQANSSGTKNQNGRACWASLPAKRWMCSCQKKKCQKSGSRRCTASTQGRLASSATSTASGPSRKSSPRRRRHSA